MCMFRPGGPTVFELARQALSSVERGYDLLAPKFDLTPFRTHDELLEAVAPLIGPPRSIDRALDLCCGTGAGPSGTLSGGNRRASCAAWPRHSCRAGASSSSAQRGLPRGRRACGSRSASTPPWRFATRSGSRPSPCTTSTSCCRGPGASSRSTDSGSRSTQDPTRSTPGSTWSWPPGLRRRGSERHSHSGLCLTVGVPRGGSRQAQSGVAWIGRSSSRFNRRARRA